MKTFGIDSIQRRFNDLMTRLGQPIGTNRSNCWGLNYVKQSNGTAIHIQMIRYTANGGHTFPLGNVKRSEAEMIDFINMTNSVLDLSSGIVSGAGLKTWSALALMIERAKQEAILSSSVSIDPRMAIVWRETSGDSVHSPQGWSIYSINAWNAPCGPPDTLPFAIVDQNGLWVKGDAYEMSSSTL